MLDIGDRMPEFALRTARREVVTQDDLLGSIAIVAFYALAFTGGWTNEMRGFQQIKGELEDLGARVVGVSTDTWASNGAFAEKEDIEFPLLSDWPEHKTCQAFGVLREGASVATRATFVFDAAGVVRAVIHDTTDVLEHPQRAIEAVRALAGATTA